MVLCPDVAGEPDGETPPVDGVPDVEAVAVPAAGVVPPEPLVGVDAADDADEDDDELDDDELEDEDDELLEPQAASRAAMAGALRPKSMPRRNTSRRVSLPASACCRST